MKQPQHPSPAPHGEQVDGAPLPQPKLMYPDPEIDALTPSDGWSRREAEPPMSPIRDPGPADPPAVPTMEAPPPYDSVVPRPRNQNSISSGSAASRTAFLDPASDQPANPPPPNDSNATREKHPDGAACSINSNSGCMNISSEDGCMNVHSRGGCMNYHSSDGCMNAYSNGGCMNYHSSDGCMNYRSTDGCMNAYSDGGCMNVNSDDGCMNFGVRGRGGCCLWGLSWR